MSDINYQSLKPAIEAVLFTALTPINAASLSAILNEFLEIESTEQALTVFLEELCAFYRKNEDSGFALVNLGGGYQFLSKPAHKELVNFVLQQNGKRKLPKSALESLAIVAYRQPITKPEIEQIRGVSCDYAMQRLLERNLISIVGKSDAPGRPILYATSEFFMDYFGINAMSDLPKISEVYTKQNEMGVNL